MCVLMQFTELVDIWWVQHDQWNQWSVFPSNRHQERDTLHVHLRSLQVSRRRLHTSRSVTLMKCYLKIYIQSYIHTYIQMRLTISINVNFSGCSSKRCGLWQRTVNLQIICTCTLWNSVSPLALLNIDLF